MNELKLDYTRKGKHSVKTKRLLLIGGILMITLSLVTLVLVIVNDFKALLLVPAIANTLVGVHFILSSVEHKILFPKNKASNGIPLAASRMRVSLCMFIQAMKWQKLTWKFSRGFTVNNSGKLFSNSCVYKECI